MCGHTPVTGGDGGHREKVSVIGAVTVSPRARRVGRYFANRSDGYFDTGEVVGFRRHLLRARVGKVIVVWDGGTNHKGPLMRAFLARNKRLWSERLPPYAPQLNPVEVVWSWLEYGQLANVVPNNLAELDDEILDRLIRLRCDPKLLRSLWDGSELPFPKNQS